MTWISVYMTKRGKNQISELKIILKQVMIPEWNSATSRIREKIIQIDLKKLACDYFYKIQG